MKQVLCVDANGVKGITVNRPYWVERETQDQYIIYNDIQEAGGYLKHRFICREVPDVVRSEERYPLENPLERAEDRFREALERIAKLTPKSANAGTAQDLHLTVKAIAESALSDHPAN